MTYTCEHCGYQSKVEAEFQTVEAGLPESIISWEETWCLKCIKEDDEQSAVQGG